MLVSVIFCHGEDQFDGVENGFGKSEYFVQRGHFQTVRTLVENWDSFRKVGYC